MNVTPMRCPVTGILTTMGCRCPRCRPDIMRLSNPADWWRCYRCGNGFVQAWLLARHLDEMHNEAAQLLEAS